MQTHFVFRQMDSSSALRGYAEERLEKIKRYFADPLRISCTFSVEKIEHIAEFEVVLRNGLQLHASEATENMYSSVDLALAKMERQVRRYKDRIRHHKGHEGRSAKVRLGVIASERETDELAEASAGAPAIGAAEPAGAQGQGRVIRAREVETERLTDRSGDHADEPAAQGLLCVHQRGDRIGERPLSPGRSDLWPDRARGDRAGGRVRP
jgi:putative sigma-54 modulation protein